ncbi:hypothetical protein GCM10009836_68970 [Pseudonocardia ailaonensis]|uniref:Uncharacterized protein n=1 Tax=Pseudonocardia ailaonensis TaxID=367279 RepID=A0ABN2NP79_9PSEU
MPEELAAGPVVELWLRPDEVPDLQAGFDLAVYEKVRRRYWAAAREWADRVGATRQQMFETFPSRRPYFADPARQQAAFDPDPA